MSEDQLPKVAVGMMREGVSAPMTPLQDLLNARIDEVQRELDRVRGTGVWSAGSLKEIFDLQKETTNRRFIEQETRYLDRQAAEQVTNRLALANLEKSIIALFESDQAQTKEHFRLNELRYLASIEQIDQRSQERFSANEKRFQDHEAFLRSEIVAAQREAALATNTVSSASADRLSLITQRLTEAEKALRTEMLAIQDKAQSERSMIEKALATQVQQLESRIQQKSDATEKQSTAGDLSLKAAIDNVEKALMAAMAASDRAVQKSESANDLRFNSVQELRGAMSDAAAKFISRTEVEARISSVAEKAADVATRIDRMEAKGAGLQSGWGFLVAAISVVVLIVGAIMSFLKH